MTNYEKVRDFHRKFRLALDQENPEPALAELRERLIREEYKEVLEELLFYREQNNLFVALRDPSKARLAKELADLLYVVYGTAASFDIPLDAVFEEVHQSNMSKLGRDGEPIYSRGKVMKGPDYRAADVEKILCQPSSSERTTN